MADYIVKDTELTSVANAIRTAGGTNLLLSFPNGFVNAVNNISGGSSDFSTASMTISDAGQGDAVIYPSVVNMGEFDLCIANQGNGGTHPVVLYQGKAGVMVQANSYTVSGDATDMGDGMVLVTGDCTITLGTSGGGGGGDM